MTALPGVRVEVPLGASAHVVVWQVKEALFSTGRHGLAERFMVDVSLASAAEAAWIAAAYVVLVEVA